MSKTVRGLADIGAEAVLIAGGGRAILLQLANPAIGHAVARHSDFATDPMRRLRHTLTFVYALVYGTDAQKAAVTHAVNRAHEPVRGAGSNTTPGYDALDPELQLWVAATLYDTTMLVHQRVIGALTDADRDAVYRDYEDVGTALQVPPGRWPADRAAFAEYWGAQTATLGTDDTVRGVAHELLHPRAAPLWVRAGMPLARLVTAGLLGSELRNAYRMPWGPRRARRYELAMTAMRLVNRMLPRRVRELPMRRLLAQI